MKISELSQSEHEMVVGAEKMNEPYFRHAQFAINFMESFVKNTSPEGVFFMLFLGQMVKHSKLAFLSALRLHHVQATFDLRFALESVCWAAYGMAHTKPEDFANLKENDLLKPLENIKCYKWLEQEFPKGNESIKGFKDALNKLSTHANIVDAHRNFSSKDTGFRYHFFDNSKDRHIKADLWSVANLTMGALDLFYGVNKEYDIIEFEDDFLDKMDFLRKGNNRLKKEALQDPNFARFKK